MLSGVMTGPTDCVLCGRLTYPVSRGSHWSIALNLNQNLLGKVMVVANRHVEDVTELDSDEWRTLQDEVRRLKRALDQLFAPDRYNFAFLMNMDPHVHLHVIPRYVEAREWRGETFTDPHFGALFGTEQRRPPDEWMKALVLELHEQLAASASTSL